MYNFSFQNTPFIIVKNLDVPKEALERLSFEEKHEGYVIDFVKALAAEVKFKYKFHLVADGKYGGKNQIMKEKNYVHNENTGAEFKVLVSQNALS